MRDLLKVIILIKEILLHPKKILLSHDLTEYNMRTMKYFIVLMLELSILVSNILTYEKSLKIYEVVSILIAAPFFFFIGMNLLITVFNRIINSVVGFTVPFKIMEKVLMPYLAASIVLALFFSVINNLVYNLGIITSIILTLWLSLQLYNIARFRVMNREMNHDDRRKILFRIALLVIGMIIINAINPYIIEQRQLREEVREAEKLQIRIEVYGVYNEVYLEIKKIMESGNGISYEKEHELNSRIFSVFCSPYNIIGLKENEFNMEVALYDMIEANIGWYEGKMENDSKKMEENMGKYNEAKNEINFLINNYVKKEQ